MADKKILVSAYSGIGDAILSGPILRSLSRLYPGRILYPENPALSLYQNLQVESLDNIGAVGREFRRLVDFTSEELLEILRPYNIEVIFNLRRDRVKFKQKYEALADSINRAGVVLTDICEFVPVEQQTRIHTFDLCQDYFRRLGLELDPHRFGWLRESVPEKEWQTPGQLGIGFYLGAGQHIKRMAPAFWCDLIRQIRERTSLPSTLICGITEEERAEGRHLSQLLAEDGIRHELVCGLSLLELTKAVSGFKLIVSCDTFLVHLSEALGVRVVGIYCSTHPEVYGPYHRRNLYVQSSFYAQCPFHNQIGNCDGWDIGCTETPCKTFVNLEEVLNRVLESIPE